MNDKNRYIVFDVEVRMSRHYDFNLRPDKILCISFKKLGTDKVHRVSDDEGYAKFLKYIDKPNTVLIGHNVLFDLVVLNRLLGYGVWQTTLCTRQMGLAIYRDEDRLGLQDMEDKRIPDDLVGSSGLEAWALRLDMEKDDEDFTKSLDWYSAEYSEEMGHYCDTDVEITAVLYEHLVDQMNQGHNTSHDAYGREHKITNTLAWYKDRDITKYNYNIGADSEKDFE